MKVHGSLQQMMHRYDNIIWDWNGTLLNDVHIAVDTICEVLANHDLPAVTVDEYRGIFGFPVYNYYKRLGFDFERIPFETVAAQFIRIYGEKVNAATLFPDVVSILSFNHLAGKRQFILSVGHQSHLDEIVQKFDVHHFFTQVYGIGDHYAGSKLDRGRDLMREHLPEPSKTVLVGDTDHDLEVGRALGVDIFLLGDGHQCPTRLEALWHQVVRTRFDP